MHEKIWKYNYDQVPKSDSRKSLAWITVKNAKKTVGDGKSDQVPKSDSQKYVAWITAEIAKHGRGRIVWPGTEICESEIFGLNHEKGQR